MGSVRKGFEALVAELQPIVFANVNEKASIACAREIAEDMAYMLQHGYTVEMCNNKDKRPCASEKT